jgi:uncharacterized damage-inducible protein DinB
MKAHLERMLRAMAWADREVLGVLRGCPAALGEGLPLFSHVLAAEHVWLARLQRRESVVPVWSNLTLDECEKLASENNTGYLAFVGELPGDKLETQIPYRNSKGEEFTTSTIDILTHVVIHGAYHRGQIARVIARAGGQTVNTDYIIFARSVEPVVG